MNVMHKCKPDSAGDGAPLSISSAKLSSVSVSGWFIVKFPKNRVSLFASSDLTQKLNFNKC